MDLPVNTAPPREHQDGFPQGAVDPSMVWVVCLCAEWCGTCREYRAVFAAQAQAHPALRFVWVDVEDQPELAGDLDVDTFPTVLVGRLAASGIRLDFAGPLLPQPAILERLLGQVCAASEDAPPMLGAADPEAQAVLARVAVHDRA